MSARFDDPIRSHGGEARLKALGADADVWRDGWGIPHIKAGSVTDAFVSLGYVHAQDRLFQMEALLRRGIGRYAEWVGKGALKGDILARQLDTEGASRRDFAALGAEAKSMLEAYAAGVNAFIAAGRLPQEYALLDAKPIAWEPWKSIAVMRQIGFLMGSVWWKLWRAAALPIVGVDNIGKLRFDDGGSDFLCIPSGVEVPRYTALLADLKPGIEALLGQAPKDMTGGSNNWALGPSRTATGRPIVAGDPHRVLEMPNMYYQAHIACEAFDAIGLTIPGVPGFPHFGHTKRVAWCVTHAFVDIHDLYVERFDQGGARYRFKDAWRETTSRRETVAIRGEAAVTVEVRATHHGPIIAGDPATGSALALRSTQFAETDRSFDCLLRMLRAETVPALYEATRGWGLIDHNLVAGDVDGRIGHRVRALVPKRPRSNGWLPVPGWTGEHEWDGMVPFERMPEQIDPPGAVIVTANNRVVAEGQDYLCTDAMPPHRARRVLARLQALDKARVEDMAAIHRDTVSIPGIELRERLRRVEPVDAAAAALRDRILAWNGEMAADSTGATAYVALRTALTRLVAERSGLVGVSESPYTAVPPGIFGESQIWWTVPQMLRANDTSLLGGTDWNTVLGEALTRAAADAPAEPWGTRHQPKLAHALSGAFPAEAGRLDRISDPIAGDNDTVFATGYIARLGPKATYGALSRYVFDVGAWENSRWITFHGASGHVDSPWYANQNPIWAKGEMVPMLYDWSAITGQAAAHLRLKPA